MKTVFYFTADWCAPCKRMRPIAEDLNRDGYAAFQFIDADHELELIKKFGIRSVPTCVLLENNEEVRRKVGAMTKEDLIAFIG